MTQRAAIYARVSTVDQHPENQVMELKEFISRRGWKLVHAPFLDHGISGAKKEEQRPGLKAVMDLARDRKIDVLVTWDLSRFARSTSHLVNALDELRDLNVQFVSLREHIDTTTANGRMVFGIFAVIAEFERELIRERVMLGLKRAKVEGKKLGRPETSAQTQMKVHALKLLGYSVRQIEAELGIGKSTVSRILSQKPPQIPMVFSERELSKNGLSH